MDASRAPRELYSSLTTYDLNTDPPLPPASYDVGVLLHVLENLPDSEPTFSRVSEILAHGGDSRRRISLDATLSGQGPGGKIEENRETVQTCQQLFQKAH